MNETNQKQNEIEVTERTNKSVCFSVLFGVCGVRKRLCRNDKRKQNVQRDM